MLTPMGRSAMAGPNHIYKLGQSKQSISTSNYVSVIIPDPQTKEWLTRNLDPVFGFPAVVRFSWATCAQILEQNAIEFEW